MSITLSALQQQRRDTAANWTSENPTLLAGEWGYESDTGKWKVGDGSTAWTSLAYVGIADQSGNLGGNIIIGGNLTVNGTTTTVNSTTLTVDDKNIELASVAAGSFTGDITAGSANITNVSSTVNLIPGVAVAITSGGGSVTLPASTVASISGTTVTLNNAFTGSGSATGATLSAGGPTDVTADGGGITLRGATDKTINWIDSTDAWTFSEHVNIASGKDYRINGTSVLSGSTLGTGVTTSSLTAVGTLTTGIWNANTIAVNRGGTGQTTYANGELLIGNSTGNTLSKATLTAGANVSITNSNGSITIAATDTNTTFTAGDGLDLSGTTFSTDLKANGGLVIESTELAVDLGASSITGTLAEGDGGTGETTYANGELLIGNGTTSGLSKATLTAGANVSITNAAGAITIAATDTTNNFTAGDGLDLTGTVFSTDLKANGGLVIESTELAVDLGAISITGTLATGDGGTGQTTYANGELLIGKNDGTLAKATLTAGTGATITNADGSITIAAAGTGLPLTGGTLTGNLVLGNQQEVRFAEQTGNGSNFVSLKAAAALSGNVSFTLPTADATTSGQALVSDASGQLSFATVGGGGFASGTVMVFHQASAPSGFTKVTTTDNAALRVNGSADGTALSSGGTSNFTAVFGSSISTDSHTLTTSEIPAHAHSYTAPANANRHGSSGQTISTSVATTGGTTGSTGSGGGHSHGMSMDLKFIDIIICSKD